ncbi:hypothetical protein [Flavicella sediminum]|uniref:hypothetical protein n=1 Tax=Flavicella sediminum TaxID=2585141 RepID=UPI00111EC6D0|nr:hypothetical protein [Flavicella sediminum]
MKTGKIITNHALKIYLGIVFFFFLMKLLNLEHLVQLRMFNFLFVVWGVNAAIKKNIFGNLDNSYLTNLSIGFSTALFAVIAVSISLIVYSMAIDDAVIVLMEKSMLWGNNLTLGHVVFAILIEGMASSVICSFLIMQYWKKHKLNTSF